MKTVQEIYQEMLAMFTQETGMALQEGSEMAVRFYALAAQVHGLYLQNQWTLEQCFPQTARGDYLDYHATLRGLYRNTATRAQGTLRFSLTEVQNEALSIPKGSVCMNAGLVRFETTQAATLDKGALFVDVPAQAVELGRGGNVPEGSVRTMALAPLGISSCSNPLPFVGGVEQEEDEVLRSRVLDSFRRMPNGANAAYYEREALSFEGVVAAKALGRSRGRGTVDVVLATATGQPGAELLQKVAAHLEERREIAVDLRVLAPTMVTLDLSVQIKVRAGVDSSEVKKQVQAALSAYFDGRRLGERVLRVQLGQMVYAIPGVDNYNILKPAQDLEVQRGQLPKLGVLTVEVLP